jgi:CxxC motif-containing protein
MYKARGLFICRHPTHRKFDFEVSPYHILKQKKCYPEGCVEFLWQCDVSIKGKKCPRGYKHVGRNCFSCKYYHEKKICRQPEALVDENSLKRFFRDLEDYEFWLSTVEGYRVSFSGNIASVFPSLTLTVDNGGNSIRLKGFLITFNKGYIGDGIFDDMIYLEVGNRFLAGWNPAPGDELEFKAELRNDRGRILLKKPSHVEIKRNGGQPLIDYSKALVGKATGAQVKDDIRLCQGCPYGALLDVIEISPKRNQYRRFYCLRGVEYSKDCLVRLERKLKEYLSDNVSVTT